MKDFLKRAIIRAIGNMRRIVSFIASLPVRIDGYISQCFFLLKRKKVISVHKPSVCQEFFKKQFVAHGLYDLPYPNNSLKLFQAVYDSGFRIIECDVMFTRDNVPILCHDSYLTEVAKTKEGKEANLIISKMLFSEILMLNFSIDENIHVPVTKFEDLLGFAKDNNLCIEIDLNKRYLGRKKCKLLYDMVKKFGLLQHVIWEVYPSDLYSFLLLDNSLIYQFDNTWNKKAILKYKYYKQYSSLIILSQWFPNHVKGDYLDIIREGHDNGFLMKCATLNREEDVRLMFKQSVDLITTDTFNNEITQIQY